DVSGRARNADGLQEHFTGFRMRPDTCQPSRVCHPCLNFVPQALGTLDNSWHWSQARPGAFQVSKIKLELCKTSKSADPLDRLARSLGASNHLTRDLQGDFTVACTRHRLGDFQEHVQSLLVVLNHSSSMDRLPQEILDGRLIRGRQSRGLAEVLGL